MSELVIKNLCVSVKDKQILKGVNLTVKEGETLALLGQGFPLLLPLG